MMEMEMLPEEGSSRRDTNPTEDTVWFLGITSLLPVTTTFIWMTGLLSPQLTRGWKSPWKLLLSCL
ncbi:hypothetical protein NC653_038127 [Populus alba x Populus x berolinensis]|uniref:Uncharacterized protein n=1 Tax=Populus alba x Populus x berolinensis TaxID=444605 RepID=A0AAD6PST5_9ROSI|nr:hypothetical protein NC653_038127 [Populus alba x Populus x berolinensis]